MYQLSCQFPPNGWAHLSFHDFSLSFALIDVIFMTCPRTAAKEKSGKENYGFPPFNAPRYSVSRPDSAVDSWLHPYKILLHTHLHRLFVLFYVKPSLVTVLNFPSTFFLLFHVPEGHETAGIVSVRAVYEIAQVKAQDDCFKMRNASIETVVKCIIGSARSLGIKIVNKWVLLCPSYIQPETP